MGQDGPVTTPATGAALTAHEQRLRRGRAVYTAVIGTVVAIALIGVVVAWKRGEISHASLHKFSPPPPSVQLASPAAHPAPAWHSGDQPAIGSPQYRGTVITW